MKCCFKDWLVLLCSYFCLNNRCNSEGTEGFYFSTTKWCVQVLNRTKSKKKIQPLLHSCLFSSLKERSGVYTMRTFQSFRIETFLIEWVNRVTYEQCYWSPSAYVGLCVLMGQLAERADFSFSHAVLRVDFLDRPFVSEVPKGVWTAMNTSY